MADKVPPPPPKPPKRPAKTPPAKPPMPPAKPPAPPAKPSGEESKSPPKSKPKPKPKPKGKPKKRPKGKPTEKSGKKRKRKGRKINIKLNLRQKKISNEEDAYSDQIGWTSMEESFDDIEDLTPKEPEIVTHQCSMCGSTMRIPRPKRERYKVICAYPECGHSDMIGI